MVTSLTEVGNNFFLYAVGGSSGPELKYAGAAYVAGQFGVWAPIGAEQTASGYEVAWKITGADQYTVWNTDSSGNYISDIGTVSGTSSALESLETSFHQDLNGDGVIGFPATVIEANGVISLTEVGNNFFLYAVGGSSGPELKYAGAAYAAGQFGAWAPIGAEQTASGYEVAWKYAGADQYTVWNTDSSGNYIANIAVVSGTSITLESYETSFHQDLNGDGVIGVSSRGTLAVTLNSATTLDSGSDHAPAIDLSSPANPNISHILAGNPSVASLLISDAFKFSDLDPNDIHSVSVSANPGAIGTLTAGVLHDTTGTGLNGEVTWDYQVNEASIRSLVASAMDSFVVSVSDHHGGIAITTINPLLLSHDFHIV
jgi:hypothetical protein